MNNIVYIVQGEYDCQGQTVMHLLEVFWTLKDAISFVGGHNNKIYETIYITEFKRLPSGFGGPQEMFEKGY